MSLLDFDLSSNPLPTLLAGVGLLMYAVLAAQLERKLSRRLISSLFLLTGLSTVLVGAEVDVPSLEAKWAMRIAATLLALPCATLAFAIASDLTNRSHRVDAKLLLPLSVVPASIAIALFGGPMAELVWSPITDRPTSPESALPLEPGPLWLTYAIYVRWLTYTSLWMILWKWWPRQEVGFVELTLLWLAAGLQLSSDVLAALETGPFRDVHPYPCSLLILGYYTLRHLRREEKRAKISLAPSSILEEMADGLMVVDMANNLTFANSAASRILGIDIRRLPRPITEALVAHQDMIEFFWGAIEGRSEFVIDNRTPDEIQDGQPPNIYDLQISPIASEAGEIANRVLVLRDISQRKQAVEELKQESTYVHLLLQVEVQANIAESVDEAWSLCLQEICQTMGWRVGHVLRLPEDESNEVETRVGGAWYVDVDYEGLDDIARSEVVASSRDSIETVRTKAAPLWSSQLTAESDDAFWRVAAAAGLRSSICVPVNHDGRVGAVMEFFSDEPFVPDQRMLGVLAHIAGQMGRVGERIRAERQIRNLAYFDGLTGLPNRQHFTRTLERAIERADQDDGLLALLFLDLDGFKRVNDTLGHSVGDELLCQVAERFSRAVRLTDFIARNDTSRDESSISRLGGDEFTVLITGIHSPQDAAKVAERLLSTMSKPFDLSGQEVAAGTSIGIALYPDDAHDAETLLRNADTAMYSAKSAGQRTHRFYNQTMNSYGSRRLELEAQLRHALRRRELHLHYQPLRAARTGELVAAEALLRWRCEELGDIGPDEFIPIAEESGLIRSIGAFVLRTACHQAREWELRGNRPIRMCVNLSGKQISEEDLVPTVREALESSGLSSGLLELEITESTIMQNDHITDATLHELADMGVGLALDDFGTGYSSLSYLRRFPLDRVKVDRSFVGEIPGNRDDAALTSAIIAMAQSLRLEVVAEGVETFEQLEFLRAHECDEVQGYLLSRPVCAEEFERFLDPIKEEEALAELGLEGT